MHLSFQSRATYSLSLYSLKASTSCLNEVGRYLLEAFLINIDEIEFLVVLRSVYIFAPLPQTLHLEWHVKVFLPFCLNNKQFSICCLNQEVRDSKLEMSPSALT